MARDRYSWYLGCSSCERTGRAEVSENDGWSFQRALDRSVDSVSEGFVVIDHGRHHHSETIIRCDCGSVADILPPSSSESQS